MAQKEDHSTWSEMIWPLSLIPLSKTSPYGLKLEVQLWTQSTMCLDLAMITTVRTTAYKLLMTLSRHTHIPALILLRKLQAIGRHQALRRGLRLAPAMVVSLKSGPQWESPLTAPQLRRPFRSTNLLHFGAQALSTMNYIIGVHFSLVDWNPDIPRSLEPSLFLLNFMSSYSACLCPIFDHHWM